MRPIARRHYIEPINPVSFGRMDILCTHCTAHHWLDERVSGSPISRPRFSHCCHHGTVALEHLRDPPEELKSLFTAQSSQAKDFREKIRQYNSALAFTSFTANEKDVNSGGGGPWVWKSGYTIYHRAGTIFPNAENNPMYAQLYFYDPVEALQYRMNRNENLKHETMESLQNMLMETNRYRCPYIFEVYHSSPILGLRICFSMPSRSCSRRLQEILPFKSSPTRLLIFADTTSRLCKKSLSSSLVITHFLLTPATSFYINVKAISNSSMITTAHTLHYTMYYFSHTAQLAGHMVCRSMPIPTELLRTVRVMSGTSHKFNFTHTACTHDNTSIRLFSLEAASFNNTYATCGFQLIKVVSDGSKRINLNYVPLSTVASKTPSNMEKETLISMMSVIVSSSHRLTLVAQDT